MSWLDNGWGVRLVSLVSSQFSSFLSYLGEFCFSNCPCQPLNKFDQFIKHKLKIKYYIRYSDDFVVLSQNKEYLKQISSKIKYFLGNELRLELHPNKISIKTLYSGQDFLGWVNFPGHRILRNNTKKRMLKRIKINPKEEVICSYLGLLKHGNTRKIKMKILEEA